MYPHHPVLSACLYGSSRRVKVVDTASGEGKAKDKPSETVDAAASFKSDVWEHFGFPVSRNEKGEKVPDRPKNNMKTLSTMTNTHLRLFFTHMTAFKVPSLFKGTRFFYLKMVVSISVIRIIDTMNHWHSAPDLPGTAQCNFGSLLSSLSLQHSHPIWTGTSNTVLHQDSWGRCVNIRVVILHSWSRWIIKMISKLSF